MIEFIKTPSDIRYNNGIYNSTDTTTVKVEIANESSLDDLMKAFKGFLQACTFPINSNERIVLICDDIEDTEIENSSEIDHGFPIDEELDEHDIDKCDCERECSECECSKEDCDDSCVCYEKVLDRDDNYVNVKLDISDDVFSALSEMAHSANITFDELCNNILKNIVRDAESEHFDLIVGALKANGGRISVSEIDGR